MFDNMTLCLDIVYRASLSIGYESKGLWIPDVNIKHALVRFRLFLKVLVDIVLSVFDECSK